MGLLWFLCKEGTLHVPSLDPTPALMILRLKRCPGSIIRELIWSHFLIVNQCPSIETYDKILADLDTRPTFFQNDEQTGKRRQSISFSPGPVHARYINFLSKWWTNGKKTAIYLFLSGPCTCPLHKLFFKMMSKREKDGNLSLFLRALYMPVT